MEQLAAIPYIQYLLVPTGLYAFTQLIKYLIPGPQHNRTLTYKDKTVLITGASTGLGRALAFELYKKGAKLILTARSIDKLKELCSELEKSYSGNENKPEYRYLDVCDPQDVEQLVTLSRDGKTIDILINNAGLSMRGPISETPMTVHRQLMEVNYFGHVSITRALLPFIPDDGAIITTSSMQGRIAVAYRSAYAASKHALQAFFDTLRFEERHNLHIMVVSAGYMNTGFGNKALDVNGKPVNKEDQNQKKGYSPEECASRILESASRRETELILAPIFHRFAIFLRWLSPNLFFYLMYKRGLGDEYRKKAE